MANTTLNTANAIRTDVWAERIKEELREELFGQNLVTFISGDFPDGDTLHIPVLSSLAAESYTENTDISIQDGSVGDFELVIDKYIQSGVAITDKLKDDTYYLEILNSKFPQQCIRALMDRLENDIFLLHKKQTNNDANTINGQAHRYNATGTNAVITVDDIAKAKLALDKANVSKNGRAAIVDPTVSYQLINIDNVIRQDVYGPNSNLKDGFGATKFIGTYLGFDFYESNMLDESTGLDYSSGTDKIANMFLGEEALIGAVRQEPDIEPFRDHTKKRDVYHVTMRYGLELFRPESLVTVLTPNS